jgi:hypothetical protein
MGAWPGKFVIGLTGNIATGKSVVRKMLEHLGAYGLDRMNRSTGQNWGGWSSRTPTHWNSWNRSSIHWYGRQ